MGKSRFLFAKISNLYIILTFIILLCVVYIFFGSLEEERNNPVN
jgi:hypothetical protein